MSVGAPSWAVPKTSSSHMQQHDPLFQCDGCNDQIPAHKARIHCQACQDFDLCANCFVIGVVSGNHAPHHPTAVIKQSGTCSLLSSNETQSPLPDQSGRTSNFQNEEVSPIAPSSTTAGPTSNSVPVNQQLYFPPPPTAAPPYPAPPTRSPAENTRQSYHNLPPPPLPPRQTPPVTTPSPQSPGEAGWLPLFNGNTPTPTFTALLNNTFTYLDPRRTGYLTPEVYSGWLDTQGYALEHNVWKKCLTPVFGQNKEDMADFEWRSSLENFSIEHVMVPRPAAPNNDMSNLVAGMNNVYLNNPGVQQILQASKPRSVSGGQMPLMTRKGFIDITVIEILYDPSLEWAHLNRALRAYGIWKDKGPLPREMLPAYPSQAILDHVKRIGEMAKYKAQQQVNANYAELKLKQQGQQNALDLLDDRRYYYY